jgi:PAS domain S-box-containing protein
MNGFDAKEALQFLIATTADLAIFRTDARGYLTNYNESVERIFGYEASEWIGQPLCLIATEFDRDENVSSRDLALARATGRINFSRWQRRKDRSPIWTETALIALLDDAGEVRGYGLAVRDQTERKRAEDALHATAEALRSSEERLRLATECAHIGTWDLDPGAGQFYWDARCREVFQLTPESPPGYSDFLSMIYAEDRDRIDADIRRALASPYGATLDGEYRTVAASDHLRRWVALKGLAIDNQDGSGARLIGTLLDVTDRKRTERETALLVENLSLREQEASRRAEREALVNQIGEAVRSSESTSAMQAIAVQKLGHALRVDRCYTIAVDAPHDALHIAHDWHANHLSPLAGDYRISLFPLDLDALFPSGKSLAVTDGRGPNAPWDDNIGEILAQAGLAAVINIPYYDNGRLIGALGVGMSEPRIWSEEEIALVEIVAAQVRSSIESTRIQQRERNIAQQLQEALQPAPPPEIPGLALKGFYRPALDEAAVGGDFYDVFPVSDGCTAVCVGDLSGKGLSAASQVATCRNMMRYALYARTTLAEAAVDLNRVLTRHNLLPGFATLFFGVFDEKSHELTYVNCGQEPALIWRVASGFVEELTPTGPVMGAFPDSVFGERRVQLECGDAFAVFTDGLTEIGPTRRDLLELQGVKALFQKSANDSARRRLRLLAAAPMAEGIVARLIAGVDDYAQGGLRDDIALLVGVVTSPN